MAPHLTKKQPASSENGRRPNIWRFISVRRFGQRAGRDSADEDEDHVRQAGVASSFYDESDRSDPILIDDDEVPDDESVCSRYSDAHSNWEHASASREDAISFAFSELLQNDAQDPLSKNALPSNSKHGAPDDVRRPDSSRTINGSTDAVINFQGLENQFDAYFARGTPSSPFQGSQQMAIDPFSPATPSGRQRQQESITNAFTPSRKGKDVQRSPDWSTAVNPWALLEEKSLELDDREAILAENARLRAELEELTAMASKETTADSHQPNLASPARSTGSRPPSRIRRARTKKRQDVTLFETTTLRDLVLKRLFTPHVIVDGIIHDEGQPLTLDTPLTAAQIQDFTSIMNDIIVSGSHLKQPIALCAVCHLPKFKGIKALHQNSYVSEVLAQLPMVSASAFEDFDPFLGTSNCCRRYVCKTCLSAAIISGISTHWWFDLQNQETNWLKCPVPCCGRNLPLYSSDEVAQVMQRLGVHDPLPYMERYNRAFSLRSQLQELNPLPGKDELRRSKALHDRLVRHRRMRPLLEDTEDENGLGVECLPIDTPDGQGTLQIPIFKRLLRNCTPRTCLVCDETYSELNTGNLENWYKIIKGFGGEWTWRIMAFPTAEILAGCQHDHDICRSCLAQYVTTQVESQGHSVVENVTCPTPDCQHKFTHAEVRSIATPETFSLYDRYTVLNSISSQPNFRWCLREGCIAGSLYDDPSTVSTVDSNGVDTNCIECSECNFTMCYSCQSPWHADLTCAQYASQRAESFTETQTWLSQNTKPCPGEGCGVQVQKGDGCFHMTCSRCHFEFCWECMADWRGIFVPGEDGGFLRADGHREGCFFRGEEAPLPTQLMGQDLETGLRRLEQRADAVPAAG
ncbi:putative RING-type domain-containing protein [Seiridium cardinale]